MFQCLICSLVCTKQIFFPSIFDRILPRQTFGTHPISFIGLTVPIGGSFIQTATQWDPNPQVCPSRAAQLWTIITDALPGTCLDFPFGRNDSVCFIFIFFKGLPGFCTDEWKETVCQWISSQIYQIWVCLVLKSLMWEQRRRGVSVHAALCTPPRGGLKFERTHLVSAWWFSPGISPYFLLLLFFFSFLLLLALL